MQVLRRTPAGRRAGTAAVLPAVLGKVLVMQKPIHKRTAGGAYGPMAMTFCGFTVKQRYTVNQWRGVTCKSCRNHLAQRVLKEAAAKA